MTCDSPNLFWSVVLAGITYLLLFGLFAMAGMIISAVVQRNQA
jgi:hypothetical protein